MYVCMYCWTYVFQKVAGEYKQEIPSFSFSSVFCDSQSSVVKSMKRLQINTIFCKACFYVPKNEVNASPENPAY